MADAEPDEDPFAGLTLDEEFVRGAPVVEDSAEARLQRARRAADDHARLVQERAAEGDALERRLGRRRRRGTGVLARDRGRLTVAFVVLLVAGALMLWNVGRTRGGVPLGSDTSFLDDRLTAGTVAPVDRPPVGVEAADAPLGTPPPVARESSAHRFVQTQPGSDEPVAWDPCRPVHVVVNDRTVVPGGELAVQEAIDAVSAATGLRFVVDGPTDEAPSADRPAYQPDRYPGRWAPVLIAWSDPVETPGLAGDVAGLGGAAALSDGERSVYVTGSIELDGPALGELADRPGGQVAVREVVEHELGHLVGLDHVEDPTQLMNPAGGTATTYADGDLTGLARLGAGDCFADL